jgi:clan AA aspartic protease (TIGR02281 family)
VVLCAGLIAMAAPVAAERVDVARELERLMQAHGFTMKPADLESTRDIRARAEGEALIPRLRVLLEDFDHIIVQGPGGGVERVLILGEKVPYVPPAVDPGPETAQAGPGAAGDIVLDTQRKGTSHAVTLTLEGGNGRRVQRVLLLDTGADYVVLPTSLIGPLSIPPDSLRPQSVQTANGTVDAQIGQLAAVWLADRRIADVDAAFIEDARLGGSALLGMSVLSRFKVTLDDDANQVVLHGKGSGDAAEAPEAGAEGNP